MPGQWTYWGVRVYKTADSTYFWLMDGFNTGNVILFDNMLDATAKAAIENQTNSSSGTYGYLAMAYPQGLG
jgi:hypothetical protein